jgi:threonine/homoserine/homoserine lactone efflux protein
VDPSTSLAAFGLGVALGTSPGPVQLLLFSEASRGGVRRGLLTMAGANGTFGLMMLLLAAGLASLEPGDPFLRVVQVVGGAFLVFLAIDAIRENRRSVATEAERPGLHPTLRGVVAVLLNPGVYVFLATTGAAVVAGAVEAGGRPQAFTTVIALLAGVSLMDFAMVLLGTGAHRVSDRALRILGDALAVGLGALGVLLALRGLAG